MAENIDALKLAKTLGRHTRLAIPFSWTLGGTTVDLQTDGYDVRVWVLNQDDTTVSGPVTCDVNGTTATYNMSSTDLEDASEDENSLVKFIAVAENGTNTLVSDARSIVVGDWGGADEYTPAE